MPIIYDIQKDLQYKDGVSPGISQNEARALLFTARKMIKEGLSIQLISKTTFSPIAELKKLKRELGHNA